MKKDEQLFKASANNYKFIPENASLKPLNSYSLSKAMFTQYLETFSILNPKIKITLFSSW